MKKIFVSILVLLVSCFMFFGVTACRKKIDTTNKYTVTWKNYDGTVLETDTNVAYGATPSYDGTTPTKSSTAQYSYTFTGWSPKVSSVTGDVTYTAQFSDTTNKYTVTWKNYDGTIIKTTLVKYGDIPSFGGVPSRDNDALHYYEFTKWNPEIKAVISDSTYTAEYEQHECSSFIIQYNANGGSGAPYSQTKTKGIDLTLSNIIPTLAGHTFVGWNNIYEDRVYQAGEKLELDSNITLFAIWEDTCEHCEGTGVYHYVWICSQCNGTGSRRKCSSCGSYSIAQVIGQGYSYYKCNSCSSISTSVTSCTWCSGKGKENKSENCSWCNHIGHFGGEAPTTLSIEARKIVLNTVSGFEYSLNKSVWQSSPIFENLVPSTSYTFYQRRATSGEIPFGETSKSLTVSTSSTTLFYVTYELNGGTNDSRNPASYYSNQSNKTLYSPSREHYNFVNWTYNGTVITQINASWASDIVLVAHWSASNYSITYNLDGGTNNSANPSSYNIESSNIQLKYPTKNGYTFIGWTGSNGNIPEKDLIIPTGSICNLTYTANWSLNTYCITYVLYGGTNALKNPSSFTIEDNIELKDAKKDYYTFEGWYTDSSFAKRITNVNGYYTDLTLYAHFVPFSYNASYQSNEGYFNVNVTLIWGGNLSNEIHSYKSGEVFYPYQYSVLIRSGYLFNGWYLDSTFNQPLPDSYVLTSDTTLYAKWFKMTNNNAVEMTSDQSYRCSGSKDKKDIYFYVSPEHSGPTMLEYKLYGKESSSYGATPSQFWIEDKTTNKTLISKLYYNNETYPNYSEVSLEAGHTYRFYITSHGSSGYAEVDIHFNTVSLISKQCEVSSILNYTENYGESSQYPNPSRDDYDFDGWYDSNGNLMHDIWDYTDDQVFTPHWKIHEFKINYNLDGGINDPLNPSSYTINDPSIALKNPTKEGYTFEGWHTDPLFQNPISTINCEDRLDYTLYAKWVNINSNYDYASLGDTHNISVAGINNQYISIVSPITQTVTVISVSDLDLYGAIHDSNMNLIYSCDDISDSDLDFSITFEMEAGKIYYIAYKANQALVSGDATLVISGVQNPDTLITGDYTQIVDTVDVVYDSSFTLPTPKKSGYNFVGWFDENDNLINVNSWNYTDNITIYAQWIKL